MDTSEIIFQIFAIAWIVVITAIPVICTVFVLSIVSKTIRRAMFGSKKKK